MSADPATVEHPALAALRRLLPRGLVAGGDAADWLGGAAQGKNHGQGRGPEFSDFLVQHVLEGLGSGLPHGARTDKGRAWPPGIVGSVTDKGRVVLVAAATTADFCKLGIDLEQQDISLQPAVQDLVPEGLPAHVEPWLGALLAISAKEAVYKAQLADQVSLGFADIPLSWSVTAHGHRATCSRFPQLTIDAEWTGRWMVTTAYEIPARNHGKTGGGALS